HLFHKAQPANRLRLVKGSHIVVRKWHDDPRCLILQNDDGRIVFVIPYEQDFCLIGTTDCDYQGDPAAVRIGEDEIAYLCEAVSRQCAHTVTAADIVWSYAGVRPLMDDGQDAAQETTRDYHLVKSGDTGQPPLVSVIGGKITTYRVLAEDVMELIAADLPATAITSWTATTPLPGGDFPVDGFMDLVAKASARYPALPHKLITRLARHYGTCLFDILGEARVMEDLGPSFGADLTAREVDYLVAREWAQTAEDIVWRRSKLGLHFSNRQLAQLADYLQARV
ncbi:MAG: FAD-dependent oxidoreductase, partial [Hyphomicrobiales bacterium]|nr:FAD-dependent oxidoreductase [Hyphomicrobiales bacterium]